MPWWIVLTLIGRDVVLAATLPVLRSRGLTALPVTYIGKAATFALMSGLPLILLGQWDALWSRVDPGVRVGVPDLGTGDVPVVGRAVPDPGRDGGAADAQSRAAAMSRSGEEQRSPSMLGGYDPEAGRNAHEADKPTLIPVPSLLRSLLSDHLDPGYAAAAQAKAAGATPNVVAGVGVADHRRAGDRRGVRRRGRAGTLDGTGCARVPTGAGRQRAIRGDRHQRHHRPPQRVDGPGGRRAAQPPRR